MKVIFERFFISIGHAILAAGMYCLFLKLIGTQNTLTDIFFFSVGYAIGKFTFESIKERMD